MNIYFPKRPIFSIENKTGENVAYQVKWTEDEDWDTAVPLEPGEDIIEWYTLSYKKIPDNYPKVQFDSIVNDEKETIEQSLNFDIRRFWHKSEPKIGWINTYQYYFELNPETNVLNLVMMESNNE